MTNLDGIQPGLSANHSLIVQNKHTAPHVGSGVAPVLATPVLVNMFEAAALAAIEHELPTGHQSLGTHLNIEHFAATPKGMRVEVVARVIRVEGRTIHFDLTAKDEVEAVGKGQHQRVVVSVDRFDERVEKKRAGAG